MILIADSGSTKTDWVVINDDNTEYSIKTKGINPFFQSEEEIATEIAEKLLPELKVREFQSVFFYGAGCAFDDKIKKVKNAIEQHISSENVIVNSDMLGAAHALCGREEGIACILGTGSNSCEYDGQEIVSNISPLGFILGDEGSGAVIGKIFIGNLLKNQLTPGLKKKFLKEYNITPQEIIQKVYRESFPNRFLATLSPFIKSNIEDKSLRELVLNSFVEFLKKNVMQYDYADKSVHFVGSVAYHYEEILREAGRTMNVKIGTILKSPMEGLIKYHTSK